MSTPLLSRRAVLRGTGTLIALPWLEAMLPAIVTGAEAAKKPPVRMAFLYVPNGVRMESWTPTQSGMDYELSPILAPLKNVKDELLVLSGLAQQKAFANGDGPGDHARAMATFLTGCQARKTSGADIKVGVSVDQVAAEKVGKNTRFASLEIGCEGGRDAGSCDSGYSCAYSNNLSWRGESTPNYKEINPRAVFDRLFGTGSAGGDHRDLYKKSILDFVQEDASSLRNKLGVTDQRKLDEYLTSIRDIERRLAAAQPDVKTIVGDVKRPIGFSREKYEEHLRVMGDLLTLAFQADLTRIATFVFANDGSNRSYRPIGVNEGHHDISHHNRDAEKLEKIQKINTFHITQLAYFLEKLKAVKEGEGTLLDNCMIVYGSGIGDGNRHNHDNLPILLAGKGGGTIKTGRHLKVGGGGFRGGVPLNNLYLSMLDRMDAGVPSLGDSTGRFKAMEE
jgi:hypothetical protein